jgi:hypothetical protein
MGLAQSNSGTSYSFHSNQAQLGIAWFSETSFDGCVNGEAIESLRSRRSVFEGMAGRSALNCCGLTVALPGCPWGKPRLQVKVRNMPAYSTHAAAIVLPDVPVSVAGSDGIWSRRAVRPPTNLEYPNRTELTRRKPGPGIKECSLVVVHDEACSFIFPAG